MRSPRADPPRAATGHGPTPALAALALATLLAALGTSIANVALPALAEAFAASFQQVQWVVLAYLLAIATLSVGAGRLGDIIGRRRLLLVGIAVFAGGSLLSGLAPALGWIVAARVMQGAGAAIMATLAMALVGQAVPQERAGAAMGLLGSMSAVGTALGPSLGGWLVGAGGWRTIFLATAPAAAAVLLLAWRALPAERTATARQRFDLGGTLLLGTALAAHALSMTVGGGAVGVLNVALLLAALLGLVLFVATQARRAEPLVGLALLRDPVLRAGLATSGLVATVMMTTLVIGPFHLVRGLGVEVSQAGLVMSAGPLVAALWGIPSGRLVDRFGARHMTLAGLAAIAAGAAGFAAAPVAAGVVGYLAPLIIATAGYALFQAANNTGVMRHADAARRGLVSGLLNLARNLGLVTGAAAMGAIFTAASGGAIDAAATATGMRATFSVAVALALAAIGLAAAGKAPAPASR